MNPFPAEHDLISLFEAEPTLLDIGVPWVYNHLTFETRRVEDHLVCEIEPASRHLRVTWERSGTELVRLDIFRVAGLMVEAERGREALVATFGDSQLSNLRLQLRPSLHVSWGNDPD